MYIYNAISYQLLCVADDSETFHIFEGFIVLFASYSRGINGKT